MEDLRFVTMEDLAHADDVARMMHELYVEDISASSGKSRDFSRTFSVLLAEPVRGEVVLFRVGDAVVGYALLIPYWSNEFGGTILWVDELFVDHEYRGRGIGRAFMQQVLEQRSVAHVAVVLEVTPENDRARRFYERLGFTLRRNSMLAYER